MDLLLTKKKIVVVERGPESQLNHCGGCVCTHLERGRNIGRVSSKMDLKKVMQKVTQFWECLTIRQERRDPSSY